MTAIRISIRGTVTAALLLALVGGQLTLAQSAEEANLDERTVQLLEETCDYLTGATSFTARARIAFDEILPTGQKLQFHGIADIAVRRPDRLRVDYQGDRRHSTLWYDGKTLTLMDREKNLYATSAAPATIDAALDFAMERYGFTVPVADLVYDDPCSGLKRDAESMFTVGSSILDGRKMHHLAATQENIDWQVWIEDGRQLVPRKLLITYKDEPGAPQYSAVLTEWDFSPRLPDRLFTFEAPEGALLIDFKQAGQLPSESAEKE